jgi:hypothetical protein
MKAILLLGAVLIATQPAHASFSQSPLADVIENSDRVVDATIVNAKVVTRKSPLGDEVCGFIYEAKVSETFKGRSSTTIRFASNEDMAPQSRHLLFLRIDDNDFPSDQGLFATDPKTNKLVNIRAGCAKALPRLKSNFLHTAIFLPQDFVKLSYWMVPPPDLHAQTIEILKVNLNGVETAIDETSSQVAESLLAGLLLESSVVEWQALRSWLLSQASIAEAPAGYR